MLLDRPRMKAFDSEHTDFARQKLIENCELMVRWLTGLLDSKGRVAEEVHAIRKLGKSLRGGFALLGLGKNSAKEIQVIGRLLASPRDAVSRLSTWDKLGWADDVSAASAIHELLVQQTHSAARKPPKEAVDWCVERVAAARKNLEALPTEELSDRLSRGLKKLQKRVAKRCRSLDRRGEDDFHDARKALKAYLGALAFLPEGSGSLEKKLAELPEGLGDENDLATLSFWLEDHGFTELFVPTLWEKIEEVRHGLRKKIMHDVAVLFPRVKG
jgi:CHAD domain